MKWFKWFNYLLSAIGLVASLLTFLGWDVTSQWTIVALWFYLSVTMFLLTQKS